MSDYVSGNAQQLAASIVKQVLENFAGRHEVGAEQISSRSQSILVCDPEFIRPLQPVASWLSITKSCDSSPGAVQRNVEFAQIGHATASASEVASATSVRLSLAVSPQANAMHATTHASGRAA